MDTLDSEIVFNDEENGCGFEEKDWMHTQPVWLMATANF